MVLLLLNKFLKSSSLVIRLCTIKHSNVRVFSNVISKSKKVQELPVYLKRDADFKISKKEATKRLEELFYIRPFVAREIITKYKKFLKIPGFVISDNYELCLNEGITHESLQSCPQVLAETDVSLKIVELKKIQQDLSTSMPLLSLPYSTLCSFVETEIETNRIYSIAKMLEIEKFEVCKCLVARPFLLLLDLNLLENNFKLLIDFGITKEEILKDLWVLRYSTSTIEKRLQFAKERNIERLKTWMVRAQPEIFENYLKRRSENRLILGDNSLVQYLSERLNCTEEIAKYLISKHPALQNKSLKKLNEIIDFLFANGFKPMHICKVPKILLHSIETSKKRLREIEALGTHLDSLYILTKSQKQYMQYYDSLVKSNKSKNL